MSDHSMLGELARRYGTPLYVYSQEVMERKFAALAGALKSVRHTICYAVKANSTLKVLDVFRALGAGFDIVSLGEMKRVLQVGGDPQKTVFAGVGKGRDEIEFAVAHGVRLLNIESASELRQVEEIARALGKVAACAFRINPDVDAGTHPYISTGLRSNKFGMPASDALALWAEMRRSPHLSLRGVDCHIGSGLTDIAPLRAAYRELLCFAAELVERGARIEYVDLGGGLGVPYAPGDGSLNLGLYAELVRKMADGTTYEFLVEPGKFLIAEAGTLLTHVRIVKENYGNRFAVVDAGMNDLIRPALYEAYHEIELVGVGDDRPREVVNIVGPVCESACFFAKERAMPTLLEGDLLAIRNAGAYGFSMASNYNSRPRPAEVLVHGAEHRLIRERETFDDLWRGESVV